MKKKSGNKDLDNELDFDDLEGLDGNMDFGGLENIDDSRSPTKPGAIAKELAEEAGKGFLDSVAKKTAAKALPESYENNYYAALDYADFAKETFDTSKSKVNKSLYKLGKEVKKILPFQSKMLDGFLEKYETDFEEFRSQTEEQIREGSIQSNLSSIFDKQLEVQKAFEAKRSAEDQVDKKQKLVVDKLNLDILSSIDGNISNQTAFTLQISKEYYRKSLELQYKSYFIQSDMLKTMRDYYKGFSLQFENIVKNTGLPDFVKLNTSERVSEVMRTQFIQNTYKQLFSSSDYIKNVKQKMANLVSEKISSITDGVDQATEALSGLNAAGEYSGGGMRVLGNVMSGMGGGILGEKLAGKISPKIKDKIKDNKIINTGANYLDMMANSPRTFFANMKAKADKGSEEYQDESSPMRAIASKLFGGASELLSVTDPGMKKFEVKKASILDHNKPAIFDNKVHRSISEIIPMYLSKILNENVNLRRMYKSVNINKLGKFKDSEEKVYDYENRKLSTKEEFRNAMKNSVFKDNNRESRKISSVADNINSLALSSSEKAGDKDDVKFLKNKKAQKSFGDFMSAAADKISKEDFNYDNIITNADKNPGLKELIEKNPTLGKYIEILKKNELSKKNVNLNEKVLDTKRVYPTLGVIELFKGASRYTGSKILNNPDGNVANAIAKAFTTFIRKANSVVTLENIINGRCFGYFTEKEYNLCSANIELFIHDCKKIYYSEDEQTISALNVLLGVMNESLFNNFEVDPITFQIAYDYSPDLQESGELGINNLIERQFGKENEDNDYVDPSKIKELTRTKNTDAKAKANAKAKLSLVSQLDNSSFGQEMKKFTNITTNFQKELSEAKDYREIGSSVKNLFTAVVKQSKDSGLKMYKEATQKLDESYKLIDKMLKEESEKRLPELKATMLRSADAHIKKIDELIAKEERNKIEQAAKLADVSNTVRENVTDEKSIKEMVTNLKAFSMAKDQEIKLLKKFKGKLQASRNRIDSINTGEGVSIQEFSTQARTAFMKFITEAKETLAEVEAETESMGETV